MVKFPGAVKKKKGPGSVEINPEDSKKWPWGSRNRPGMVKFNLRVDFQQRFTTCINWGGVMK